MPRFVFYDEVVYEIQADDCESAVEHFMNWTEEERNDAYVSNNFEVSELED